MSAPPNGRRAVVEHASVPSALDALAAGCSFASLPRGFYAQVAPRPLRAPRLLHVGADAAARVGLDAAALDSPGFLALCSGSGRLAGIAPLATVYSGHQFGVWAGQLGDGRAHLLGDVQTPDGTLEIQLKGSGRTPYSRMGDGWAVLRSSVREYLASEAMASLGIPTTRALALVASDDPVVRETVETAAIVTRLAPSFVRFGHFEHWGHSHHEQKALLDYVVGRWYPECRVDGGDGMDAPATACRLLAEVTRRTARLIAQWQLVGFCHGVMNTDNMSILGLTLDYGPYGFMDAFEADHVCNHSDTAGRYAWNAQPAVARWNLYRLAGSLLVLGCEASALEACLAPFEAEFLAAYRAGLGRKLGLSEWRPDDAALEDDWWALLQTQRADFTLAFRRLSDADRDAGPGCPCSPPPARRAPGWTAIWPGGPCRAGMRPHAGRVWTGPTPSMFCAIIWRNAPSKLRSRVMPRKSTVSRICCGIRMRSAPASSSTPAHPPPMRRRWRSVVRLDGGPQGGIVLDEAGLAEQPALRAMDAQDRQPSRLGLGFDAFGRDRETQRAGHPAEMPDDFPGGAGIVEASGQAVVDLDAIQRQFDQRLEVGVAGAEIVQMHLNAQGADCPDDRIAAFGCQQAAFGQFHVQEGAPQRPGQIRKQLDGLRGFRMRRRQIDRKADGSRDSSRDAILGGQEADLFCNVPDQTDFLGHGNEDVRPDECPGPPDQRFDADGPTIAQVNDWLIGQAEFALCQGLPQSGL